jgi:arylsulfatase A-like enzyme
MSTRSPLPIRSGLIAALFLLIGALTDAKPKNVLFIAIDDLRPELATYGHPIIQSPNIDRLAASGIQFNRAYCNIPVCGASRASLLSGVRPGRGRFTTYNSALDRDLPGATSLPMQFRQHGYKTLSLGKIFNNPYDGHGSWDIEWRPKPEIRTSPHDYQLEKNIALDISGQSRGRAYEMADVEDEAYKDGKIATRAIEELESFKASGEPFFLAVGFLKPHLPFNAPKEYWDLYPDEVIQLPKNMHKPEHAPDISMHPFSELRNYHGIPAEGQVSDDLGRKLIHGYYACVSYVDAQVGRVLDALEASGLADNTIVVLWGDHGWHLGEHGLWSKHCNFEKVLHSPLIIRAPGEPIGIRSDQLVEFVDVYPTLCDLAGLPLPFQLQGDSLAPLISGDDPSWKEAVFCRWGSGETIITPTHAYTEWIREGKFVARMLYDHTTDREETVNIAEFPENQNLVQSLHDQLMAHLEKKQWIELPPRADTP